MTNQIDTATQFSELCAAIRAQLGAAIVSPGDALQVIPGAHPVDAANAARQRLHRGTYPFPLVEVAPGRRAVLVTDIAKTLLAIPDVAQAEPDKPTKRKPGRPRKARAGDAS